MYNEKRIQTTTVAVACAEHQRHTETILSTVSLQISPLIVSRMFGWLYPFFFHWSQHQHFMSVHSVTVTSLYIFKTYVLLLGVIVVH